MATVFNHVQNDSQVVHGQCVQLAILFFIAVKVKKKLTVLLEHLKGKV